MHYTPHNRAWLQYSAQLKRFNPDQQPTSRDLAHALTRPYLISRPKLLITRTSMLGQTIGCQNEFNLCNVLDVTINFL